MPGVKGGVGGDEGMLIPEESGVLDDGDVLQGVWDQVDTQGIA